MIALWPEFAMQWGRMGLASTPGTLVSSAGEAEAAAELHGLPIAARPLCPAGEYCAILAEHTADVELAFVRAAAQSQDGRVIVQKHLPWPVLMIGAIRVDAGWLVREPVLVGLLPKYALTPIEFTCPAGIEPETVPRLRACVADALAHMHQVPHAAMCEFAITPLGIVSVFARDVRVLDKPLTLALEIAEASGAACLRYFTPSTGQVERIEGIETAQASPGIVAAVCNAQPGDALRHVTSIAAREAGGYLLVHATTPAEAQQRARDATDLIQIVTTAMM